MRAEGVSSQRDQGNPGLPVVVAKEIIGKRWNRSPSVPMSYFFEDKWEEKQRALNFVEVLGWLDGPERDLDCPAVKRLSRRARKSRLKGS